MTIVNHYENVFAIEKIIFLYNISMKLDVKHNHGVS